MPKTTTKKTASPDGRLDRVRVALSKYVALPETVTTKAISFAHRDDWWGVLFGNGTWTGGGHYRSITGYAGYVGGFNINAPDLAWIAADLKLITEEEAEAFGAWFQADRRHEEEASEIEQARRVAVRHGYTLKKIPARRTRR